jgi:hypothetical protein
MKTVKKANAIFFRATTSTSPDGYSTKAVVTRPDITDSKNNAYLTRMSLFVFSNSPHIIL